MSRNNSVTKIRPVVPDALFTSKIISKMINYVMKAGAKSIASSIVYGAIDDSKDLIIELYNSNNDEVENIGYGEKVKWFMLYLVNKVIIMTEVKSRRIGGSNYQIPTPVSLSKATRIAIARIVNGAKKRSEKTARESLTKEFSDIVNEKGEALKKREEAEKLANANKAFAHYANY